MNRKYIMKAEKAASLSAFADYYGMPAYESKLECIFGKEASNEKTFSPEKTPSPIHPGQEIVLCGYIAMAGTLYLLEEESERLSTRLPQHFIREGKTLKNYMDRLPDPEEMRAHGVTAMYLIGEGGLLGGLCRLAADSRTGFRIDYEEVPVKQITIECCEIFDWNPWQLMSGGCVLLVTDRGYETVRALEKLDTPCRTIGYITSDQDKLICHGEIHSCLNRPEADELLKAFR